jgi:predicted dehydrogenase
VQAVEETGIKLSVAHYRREQPLFKKIKELLVAKAIGEVRFADIQYLRAPLSSDDLNKPGVAWRVNPAIAGGGLFHDLAPHQLDLMLYFFGKVKKASGLSLNQGGLYAADDIVTGEILFENKVLVKGLWCFTAPPEEAKDRCEIVGTEGKISFSVFEQPVITLTKKGKEEVIRFDALAHVQQPMIAQVVAYFLNEAANPCSAQEGLTVMQLLDTFTTK